MDKVNRVGAGLAATALVVTRQPGLLGSLSVTQRQVSSLPSHQEPREGPVDASRGLRVHPPRLGPKPCLSAFQASVPRPPSTRSGCPRLHTGSFGAREGLNLGCVVLEKGSQVVLSPQLFEL